MPSPYQGVILAAGRGSRMGVLAEALPKALLPVGNVPLIHRHLADLKALGVREVIIVIGHLGSQIEAALGDGAAWDLAITYVEQRERHGLAHAVGQLESQLHRPFYLVLGDICFEFDAAAQLRTAFERNHAAAALAVRQDNDPAAVRRNFSVDADAGGRVRRVVEKPERPVTACKGCGLYLFDRRIFDAIRRTPRSQLRNEYELTDTIQVLIDDGAPVQAVPVVAWDVNITEPADLIACSIRELAQRGLPSLLGRDCRIASGATLIQTVVGDGAHVVHPIRLERCVVLPGAVVDSTEDLTDSVIAPRPHTSGSDAPRADHPAS